jgi:hypothetical protein
MKIRFERLILRLQQGERVFDFSHVTYLHGQISSGKSSVARLIDYCLGGDLERTSALQQEFVSALLVCEIGDYTVIFRRDAGMRDSVELTWEGRDDERGAVLAPLTAETSAAEFDPTAPETLSDWIFYFLGREPIRVRRSKRDPDAPLVRLGFRDFLVFSYLPQDLLDSSFFRFEDRYRRNKNVDVMRVMLGTYDDVLVRLEEQQERLRRERDDLVGQADHVQDFFDDLGVESEDEFGAARWEITSQLAALEAKRDALKRGEVSVVGDATPSSHPTDELRGALRTLGADLGNEQTALLDLREQMRQEEALRAELVTARFKLARTTAAAELLEAAPFAHCPQCGSGITHRPHPVEHCALCLTDLQAERDRPGTSGIPGDAIDLDLASRLAELDDALQRHRRAERRQKQFVGQLSEEKARLDARLNAALAAYDSARLAAATEIEAEIATLTETQRSLARFHEFRTAIISLRERAADLVGEMAKLRDQIKRRQEHMTQGAAPLAEVAEAFLEALLRVGVPGVTDADIVEIDEERMTPVIVPGGGQPKWGFENAGSGGKKTLFQACYALALHQVATSRGLPLPRFLIIDTPMKNIGEDVDQALFENFYAYLYELASGPLRDFQFVIIDKEFETPPADLDVVDIYMTRDDPAHPPLVPYYTGP